VTRKETLLCPPGLFPIRADKKPLPCQDQEKEIVMKRCRRLFASSSWTLLTAVLTIVFALCVGPAKAAPEPGVVTIVLDVEPRSLDPGELISMFPGQVMMKNILEPLTVMNPADSSLIPRLATSWKRVDANTWHFVLRKGVKFHDGEDFNAEAVVFSIKRLFDKRIESNTRGKFFGGVNMEGRALDHYTLEVKTESPQPLLPTFMGVLPVCSPHTPMDKWTRNPIGTGPYRLVKWDAGQQIVLERFDGYWGKQPQVKKAIYVWRNESSVRAAMVLIGEADLAPNIAKQDANNPDVDHSYFNAETSRLRIGGDWDPPLNDRRVRLALNYAVDRNAIRGSILSKDVVPATQLVVPSTFGHNPDLKVWPYDPKKAKQLLDEARKDGVPVDKEITLIGRIGIHPGAQELMEAVMTMYQAIGLNVKLKMVDPGVYRTYANKPYPAGLYIMQAMHDNNKGDAGFTGFYFYHCKGGSTVVCDKTVDELIEKAQVATGEERKNLWRATFKRIYEETVSEVMLYHMVGYARIGKRIQYKPSIATNCEIALEQITVK
jgi:peptide/nickel transport system substrate-binding protein